jgi:hypothetical protein
MSEEEKINMATNSRKAAEYYDFQSLTKLLINIIENR